MVPTPLIVQIAHLRGGAGLAHRALGTLAKAGLVARPRGARYDGYRLTYGGLDYLALRAHTKAGVVGGIGSQIGTGKESDIYVCAPPRDGPVMAQGTRQRTEDEYDGTTDGGGKTLDEDGSDNGQDTRRVLKLHRLGRTSFRTVKANRDYLRGRHSGSWMHMSRLAALKEHAFMRALHAAGFRVPTPLGVSRHAVVMALVDGTPLRSVEGVPDPPALYAELLEVIVRLAGAGLIHGDFNEFNVMIVEERAARGAAAAADPPARVVPVLIDFPQMVSTSHANARMYFDRDVACVKRFFERRFGFVSSDAGPSFDYAMKQARALGEQRRRLDVEVEASGFSRKMAKELEGYMKDVGVDGDGHDADADQSLEDEDGSGNSDNEDDRTDAEPATDGITVDSDVKPPVASLHELKISG